MSAPQVGHGVPTEADVNALLTAFGVPSIGCVVTHSEIVKTIHAAHGTVRYKSVITAWKKVLERDHALLMVSERGVGYKAADDSGASNYSAAKLKSGIKAHVRSRTVDATLVDRSKLSEAERRAFDHRQLRHGLMDNALRRFIKADKPPTPPKAITA